MEAPRQALVRKGYRAKRPTSVMRDISGRRTTPPNLFALPEWLSDTLCRLASGGAFAVRRLYTDEDEVLFEAARPVILNGIEDVVTRPDLADRALFVTMRAISEAQRRPEKELWQAFERDRPYLTGALLDAASHGLRAL